MKNIIMLSISLLLLFYSCSPVRVSNTKASEDFSLAKHQTFNFLGEGTEKGSIPAQYQDEMDLIKAEIAFRLEQKGLKLSQEPDLLINIGAVAEDKAVTRETNFRDAPRYIGQRRYSWKSEEIVVEEYKMGTITVEIVDRETNRLVWRGVAKGVIPEDQEKLRKNIQEGVEKLISKIPDEG